MKGHRHGHQGLNTAAGSVQLQKSCNCLARRCCETSAASASRRDNTIVAWHEVPGKASLESTVPEGTV
jgi:hypothetical protein